MNLYFGRLLSFPARPAQVMVVSATRASGPITAGARGLEVKRDGKRDCEERQENREQRWEINVLERKVALYDLPSDNRRKAADDNHLEPVLAIPDALSGLVVLGHEFLELCESG